MDLQIAWRNIWRNPRRTAVILTAVVIGVWSMVFLGALMRGIVEGMIQHGINTLTGDVQIHERRYPLDPSVNHRMEDVKSIRSLLEKDLPAQSRFCLRVRVNAVAANARHNFGVTLVGIDPLDEARVSFIGSAVVQGRYLKPGDNDGIIIGRALADRFETRLGRKLILMAQDTRGEIASRAFLIRGIFRAGMESTEKTYVFVTRQAAQQMLSMGNTVSEIAIMLPAHDQAAAVARRLRRGLAGRDIAVRTWRQALPLLDSYLELYDNFILIWFVVVFVAMGFGIVNTTLMAVFERMREFGLLKALGMRPRRIIRGILTESLFILIVGMAVGNLLGLISCWALSFKGIDLSALAKGVEYAGMSRVIFPDVWPGDLLKANLVVLVLGLLVSFYPAIRAARFTPVEAMRQN
jgi:ABC-type lipoprotein release transport system permease subunit